MIALSGAVLTPPIVSYLVPAAHAEDKPDKAKDVRNDLKKLLGPAQKQMNDGKYEEALQTMADVDKVTDQTPYEAFVIAQFRAICYSNLKDVPNSIKYMAILADSGLEDPDAQLRTEKNLFGSYYNQKDYPNAAKWGVRFMKDGGKDAQVSTMLADAYYLSGDYTNAETELSRQIAATEAAGQKPTEEDLHMLISCYVKQKDDAGYVRVMEKWAVDYPDKDHWRDLVGRIESKPGFADRLVLDIDRFEKAVGALENSDYLEWSGFAMDAGLPAEAKSVFDAGVQLGAINPAGQKQLSDRINKLAADDKKALAQGDAELAKAKDGNPFVNDGSNYLNYGQYDKGAGLIEQGIAKGGLKHPDDAKLHLGYAYYLAGQKDKAVEAFKTVGGTDGAAAIARLWVLFITGKSAA
jgi:tetratricopeptide (TPR) repeat protein